MSTQKNTAEACICQSAILAHSSKAILQHPCTPVDENGARKSIHLPRVTFELADNRWILWPKKGGLRHQRHPGRLQLNLSVNGHGRASTFSFLTLADRSRSDWEAPQASREESRTSREALLPPFENLQKEADLAKKPNIDLAAMPGRPTRNLRRELGLRRTVELGSRSAPELGLQNWTGTAARVRRLRKFSS